MENISEYTTKQYPIWFKATLIGIQNSMRIFWDKAQNAKDNKEKCKRSNTIDNITWT
jgi:hypothetical protein